MSERNDSKNKTSGDGVSAQTEQRRGTSPAVHGEEQIHTTGAGEAQTGRVEAQTGDARHTRHTDYHAVWDHDHWFWPYLKQHKGKLAFIFFLGVMTFVCGAGLMFTSGYLISRSARHPYNILMVYVPIVLTRAFGIGRPTFKYVERLKSHDWVLHVVSKLRVQLYRTLSKDAAFLSEHERTGAVLSLLADDLDHLEDFYLRTIFPTIVAYVVWLAVTVAMGVFSWITSLLLFIMLALVLVLIPMISLNFSDGHYLSEKAQQRNEYTAVTESYLGLSDWVISHKNARFSTIGSEEFVQITASKTQQKRFERWRNFAIQMIFALIAAGLLVGASFTMTSSQSLANWAAAVVLAVFPLVDCFIVVAQAVAEVPLYTDSLSHLNGLSERVEARQEEPVEQRQLDGALQTIDFNHVTFSYGPGQPVLLDDFSLHIKAGEKVALLGPSGEGKTTILQLLLGDLRPDAGEILINGIPVAALQDERPRIFGYLNQQAFLFNESVAYNVRVGVPEASDDDVWAALKAVQLDDTVRALPEGIESTVAEAGQSLSGGQRQRLALARIVLKASPVVLLDEPTIGLDPITERGIMDMVMQAAGECTLLWVTHHLQGLEDADQVVFLENGHIAMQGRPSELYQTNNRFRELYRLDVGDLAGM